MQAFLYGGPAWSNAGTLWYRRVEKKIQRKAALELCQRLAPFCISVHIPLLEFIMEEYAIKQQKSVYGTRKKESQTRYQIFSVLEMEKKTLHNANIQPTGIDESNHRQLNFHLTRVFWPS